MPDSDPNRPAQTFVTGEWTVEPSRNLLVRGEEKTHLEPRVMDALVYLAERPGRVVAKDELVKSIWQDRCVTDDAWVLALGGRYDEGLHETDRALALNPRSFEAYLMKGWI